MQQAALSTHLPLLLPLSHSLLHLRRNVMSTLLVPLTRMMQMNTNILRVDMFCASVSQVTLTVHLPDLNLSRRHFFLNPKLMNLNVSHFTQPPSARYPLRRAGVRAYPYPNCYPNVPQHAS